MHHQTNNDAAYPTVAPDWLLIPLNACVSVCVCPAAVLFYDLFELVTFQQRSVAAAAGGGSGSGSGSGSSSAAVSATEEVDGEEEGAEADAVAAVQQLEAVLGPQEQFYR